MIQINPETEVDYSQDFDTFAVRNTSLDALQSNKYNQDVERTLANTVGLQAAGEVEERSSLKLVDLKNSPQFNWTVTTTPVRDDYEGAQRTVKNYRMMVRQDTKRQLGLVRGGVTPLQNHHLFNFLQPFEDSGSYALETAASLEGGRTVIALMRNLDVGEVPVTANDTIGSFLLAKMTRNSKPSIQVGEMLMRLVCSNGMIGFQPDTYTIDQNNMAFLQLQQVQELIQQTRRLTAQSVDKMKDMVGYTLNDEAELDTYLRQSLSLPWNDPDMVFETDEEEEAHEKQMKRNKRTMRKLYTSYENERYSMDDEAVGTLWHAYQAVTRFTTHERSKSANSRYKSVFWGKARSINQKAFSLADKLLQAA